MPINPAIASPAGFARHASNGHWRAAPHLLLLNRVLMAAAAGEKWASRVIIQMPPRHGKSEFVSGHFPAWYLGMYPDRKVVLASYEHDLAASWGQKNRDLLEHYGPKLFGIRVRQDTSAKNRWQLQRKRGGMFTTGIGGALTGKGANLAIIDDPVKNDQEALSPTYRERNKSWYKSVLRTRLEGHGAIVVIQTRWHDDDLAGWLQKEADEDWLVLSLPAIAEQDECIYLPDDPTTPAWTRKAGEALWPSHKPLAALEQDMAAQGGENGHWWLALYQQRPVALGGGILKPEQFRTYTLSPDGNGYLLDTPNGPRLAPNTTEDPDMITDLPTARAALRAVDRILAQWDNGTMDAATARHALRAATALAAAPDLQPTPPGKFQAQYHLDNNTTAQALIDFLDALPAAATLRHHPTGCLTATWGTEAHE